MEKNPSFLKRGEEISFEIPRALIQEFQQDIRIVIRYPWLIGIPVPEVLLKPEMVDKLGKFDIIMTPKELYR